MVRFENDRYVIEVPSHFPADQWLDNVRDLVYCIGAMDKDRVDNNNDCIYGLCSLLLEMLPDEDEMREMLRAKGIIEK